jgi:hypothetical protein
MEALKYRKIATILEPMRNHGRLLNKEANIMEGF